MSNIELIGFKGNKSNPYMLLKWTQDEVIMIGIYVNGFLLIGKRDITDELIVKLKNLKVENTLKDYLSFQLIENAESKEILILQPHLINQLVAKFGDEVKNKRVYKTLGAPRLKFFTLKMMMTSLNQICRLDTVLE
jgi:hypothetical protein